MHGSSARCYADAIIQYKAPQLLELLKLRGLCYWQKIKSYCTASANSAPALNLMTFFAGIWIFSLLLGFIPSLAGRSLMEKVPKPRIATLSPFFKASEIASTAASNAFFESAFVRPASAIAFMISVCSYKYNIRCKYSLYNGYPLLPARFAWLEGGLGHFNFKCNGVANLGYAKRLHKLSSCFFRFKGSKKAFLSLKAKHLTTNVSILRVCIPQVRVATNYSNCALNYHNLCCNAI